MKLSEAIDRAKSNGCAENVSRDILRDAIVRLEKMIAEKAEVEIGALTDNSVLLACGGGVAEGYDDMYDAYLKREASRICEAWDNLGNYDALFSMRYAELCKEILRNRKPKRFEFR